MWKNENFSLTKEIFRQINSLIISIVKFLDAGIQDVSTSISIVNDKTEMSAEDDDDGDESDKHK